MKAPLVFAGICIVSAVIGALAINIAKTIGGSTFIAAIGGLFVVLYTLEILRRAR